MRKLMCKLMYVYVTAIVGLVSALGWHGSAATTLMPNPDDGAVKDGIFANAYFNLSYHLPPGWVGGLPGAGPSVSGYYVLATFVPSGELTGTILIAAQDIFFADKAFDDVMTMASEFSRAMSLVDGMTIDRPPSEVWIANRRFSRVDFSGVELFRSTWITKIRCHFVSFNFTAKSPELLATLVLSLKDLGPASDKDAGRVDPTCVDNYADAQHLLSRVDPIAVGPSFAPVPVRIVFGTDGSVTHVHVIRANSGQRESIETALRQWKFKLSHEADGRANEIETGLVIRFAPTGGVSYSIGNRP